MANSTRPKRPASTHSCPGDCGQQVPRQHLACRSCWYLLPQELREELTRLYGRDRIAHLGAVGDCLIWFRENVKDGELVAG
ncbi:hypothetical protein [Lentzea guizhouensis]|uniref:hypothetical protein n=1 Tax=Lentzea guizhouensis TaxID=1586287 RepID=UPI0012B687D6|nr:hypothetical protein [Lentzea guizhouensis]